MSRKTANEELGRLSPEEYRSAEKTPIIIVLDNVRSLNNIGSVFRTSDAFRLEAIYLCGITATPPHREIEKTALGATVSVNWQYFPSTIDAVKALQLQGYKVIAIEQAQESILLQNYQPTAREKIALVFGNEVMGVEQAVMDIVDTVIEIPQFGTKHSFNISVSVGIVVWELWRKISA
jgi:tRNA G18 (ribose-2'-O)-methylase SpoU